MKTIHTTVGFGTPYSIIPDTLRSLLQYSDKAKGYNILKGDRDQHSVATSQYISDEELKNRSSHVGYITIEEPGNIVSYTANGSTGIDQFTLDELVDVIKHHQMLDCREACS